MKLSNTICAIVLGSGPNALGVIRSLDADGIQSIVVTDDLEGPATQSCHPTQIIETSLSSASELYEAIRPFSRLRFVLIPTADSHVDLIQSDRALFDSAFEVLAAPPEITQRLLDKAEETLWVSEAGIDLPETIQILPDSPSALLAQMPLPILIKPRSFDHFDCLGGLKNVLIKTEAEMESFYFNYGEHRAGLIAQEVIPGDETNLWVANCVFDASGDMVQAFSFNRLATAPARYGVTSLAVSVENAAVKKACRTLGHRLNLVGPVMIEFKRDPRDGRFKYIELNPRVGLCNIFDTRCGINNVALACRLAIGQPLPAKPPSQREGVMFHSLYDDTYARLADGCSIWEVILAWRVGILRRRIGLYWDHRDPRPGLYMLRQNLKAFIASGMRRVTFMKWRLS